MKYPKIETLYVRSKETFKVLPSELRLPEFGLVRQWLVTEKIDGTNVRVILTPDGNVEIRGRTDKAQFNPVVLQTLQDMFPVDQMKEAFEVSDQNTRTTVILYGEGYGEKIQSGGKYRKGQSFRLFDVRVGDWWLNWDDVEDVAAKLRIKAVPVLTRRQAWVPTGPIVLSSLFFSESGTGRPGSHVTLEDLDKQGVQPEGIVARTDPLLFTRRGDRVMWKLKFKDF